MNENEDDAAMAEEAHQAYADSLADAKVPSWLGTSQSVRPAVSDEFDVRLHRHEVELLVEHMTACIDGRDGPLNLDMEDCYRMRAGILQTMLDNPLGGWVERTGRGSDVHRLATVVRATLLRALGPGSALVWDEELAWQGEDIR